LPLTLTDLVAAEGFSACVPLPANLSPLVAAIIFVALRKCLSIKLV
jgi:hypothetical protein